MVYKFMRHVAAAALCYLPAVSFAASEDPKDLERVLAKIRSEPMIFVVATSEPNACGRGCSEWIATQGQFDEGAAQRLREFLAILAKRDLPIFFNSDGGLVSQAVQIGLLLRENRMTAGVARTVPPMIRAKIGGSLIDLTTLSPEKGVAEKSFDLDLRQLQSAIGTGSFEITEIFDQSIIKKPSLVVKFSTLGLAANIVALESKCASKNNPNQ